MVDYVDPDRFVRTAGNYDPDKASDDAGLECADPSLAVQSQKEEADINTIVRNFGVTGNLPQGVRLPSFEDYGDAVDDYASALRVVQDAEREFMKLPAEMRSELGNSPQAFYELVTTPGNEDKLRAWGLLPPLAPPPAA